MKYIEPDMEIILFDSKHDVITLSAGDGAGEDIGSGDTGLFGDASDVLNDGWY